MTASYRSVCQNLVEKVLGEKVPDATYDMLELAVAGKKYDQIAADLDLALTTVKNYLRQLWVILGQHFTEEKVTRFNIKALLDQEIGTTAPIRLDPKTWPLEIVATPSKFVGRTLDLAQLGQAITVGGLTLIIGQTGIGKTAFVAQQLQNYSPSQIIWQTIDVGCSLQEICMALGRDPASMSPAEHVGEIVAQLRSEKSILVIDQAERLLASSGISLSPYSPEYVPYGQLLEALVKRELTASVIVISQVPFRLLDRYIEQGLPIRKLALGGLSQADVQQLAQLYDVRDRDVEKLHALYEGHPACLRGILGQIASLYGGRIDEFLKATAFVGHDVKAAYQISIDRLATPAQIILKLLRERLTLQALTTKTSKESIKISREQILETLEMLEQMQLIEVENAAKPGQQKRFKVSKIVEKCFDS